MSACALTGHRVLGKGFSRERLEQCLRALIAEGADTFYCGMALGFDLDQAARYSPRAKEKYEALLSACDEKIVLHEKYENGCMFERNRCMVDRCDVLLAYLETERGGTFYTVNYAKKRGKRIVFL